MSSNGFDVAGAKRFGFRVAWIERGGAHAPADHGAIGPAEFYRMIRGRAEHLGYEPDHRVRRLTDLASLLGPSLPGNSQ